jgi:hypothetical protein
VTCPYSEPNCAFDITADSARCLCGRAVKRCAGCNTRNRAFANFCRACGMALSPSITNWSGYRGGPRRLGVHDAPFTAECVTRPVDLRMRLGDPCRSLLGHDGHVIAISASGVVEIADPMRARSVCRFQAQGPMTAEPCIRDGVLYLAARGRVSAYPLAAMTLDPPRVRPLWQVPLNGTPIHALTAAGDRLYVTVATADWREVHVIEHERARLLQAAAKVSWIAADPDGTRVVFFTEDDGHVQLHTAGEQATSQSVALPSLRDHPIALLGNTIFGIFGEGQRLYRVDASTGDIEEPLDEDTQFFALTHDGDEWDRDRVCIDSRGILFSGAHVRDSFGQHERASRGSPVIVQGCAVAVGMEDGRVLVYDTAQLPRHEIWRLGDAPITALASFDSYIVAGNKEGLVDVRELLPKGSVQ